MTRLVLSLCLSCKRNTLGGTCLSFPDGIPEEIWRGEADHREPIENEVPYDPDPDKADLLDAWLFHSGFEPRPIPSIEPRPIEEIIDHGTDR